MAELINIEELGRHNLCLPPEHKSECMALVQYVEPFRAFGEVTIFGGFRDTTFQWFVVHLQYKDIRMRLKSWNDPLKPPYAPTLVDSLDNEYTRGYTTGLLPPAKVGKPTQKKLDQWRTYLLAVESEKRNIYQTAMTRETEFRHKLEAFWDKVSWSNEHKIATLEMGDLTYTLRLDPYAITEKITLSRNLNHTLDTFLLLADNGIKRQKDEK